VTFAGKSGSLTGIAHDAGVLRGPGGSAVVAVLTQGFEDPYEADAFIGTIGTAVAQDLQLG
jgi:beta-lactamase class A